MFRWASAAVLLATSGQVLACGHVAPYERQRLAHPTMSTQVDADLGRANLFSVQEGAAGGAVDLASGCGCN